MQSLKKLLLDNIYLFLLAGVILIFFYPVFVSGKIPIPADTIVGMYHPWRDKIWGNYASGVPYKNFLVTDPVRQQYVWRSLALDQLKKGQLPLWNPYSFSGTPLLANFQAAPFYPLNILYFFLPFNIVWTIQIILQPLLGGVFLYLYLRYLKVSKTGSFLGGFAFAFSGFSIAWLEWNTIIQTVLWLPLILLAKEKLLERVTLKWLLILFFAEISSFFAGHLQVLFYSLIVSNIYLLARIVQLSLKARAKDNIFIVVFRRYLPFLIIGIGVLAVTFLQWFPTIQFILQSSRDFDQGSFMKEGWFIPWQNLVQFLVPDFFGNPATGNYWGVWNYGEFIGFIGFVPLVLSIYALIFRRDKKILFFGSLFFVSLIFALPTPFAKLPFILKIPLLSTSQPTRLMYLIDFSLCILAGLGFDYFMLKGKIRLVMVVLLPSFSIVLILWLFTLQPSLFSFTGDLSNLLVSRHNLVVPAIFMALSALILIFISSSMHKFRQVGVILLLAVVIVELLRFGWKFTPFSNANFIFPQTEVLSYLTQNTANYRIMSVDRRIIPPNFSVAYNLEDVGGYDPLYLKNYGQLVAAWERGKPDISPAAFNRIVTPSNYESFIADLFGVKFVVSLNSLKSDKLDFISKTGDTYIYANKKAFPRIFMAEQVLKVNTRQEVIDKMFELGGKLDNTAVTLDNVDIPFKEKGNGEGAEIASYSPNRIYVNVKTDLSRMLVLTDVYFPSWKAYLDGKQTRIYQVDFALRGVVVPAGSHTVEFKDALL